MPATGRRCALALSKVGPDSDVALAWISINRLGLANKRLMDLIVAAVRLHGVSWSFLPWGAWGCHCSRY